MCLPQCTGGTCPAATGATAIPTCEFSSTGKPPPDHCGLRCKNGETCPTGTSCQMPVGICAFPYPMSEPEEEEDGMETTFHVAPAPEPEAAKPPPPPPPSAFCPKYHPIHAPNVYDPSGPLLDEQGNWHTWEDAGAWSHWVSKDLIHWKGDFKTSTHFGGDTGSVSPTPSGVYAFWPIMGGPGKGSIGSAKSKDPSGGMTQWDQRGPTIPMPSRINAGFRDPVRAFE